MPKSPALKKSAAANATASEARSALRKYADTDKAVVLARFFKTGKGQYGEGDVFLGVKVPYTRTVAKSFRQLPLSEVDSLLKSNIHEERLLAVLILVLQYQRGNELERERIFRYYVKNARLVNNWDLVDTSAEHIIGAHLFERDRSLLHDLVRSKNLWERRIAIMSTFHFIKRRDFEETLAIAEKLLGDTHDLIHKAVGWMLREVGNRHLATEEKFLRAHASRMPRTMLRYAIERLPAEKRAKYLAIKLIKEVQP